MDQPNYIVTMIQKGHGYFVMHSYAQLWFNLTILLCTVIASGREYIIHLEKNTIYILSPIFALL